MERFLGVKALGRQFSRWVWRGTSGEAGGGVGDDRILVERIFVAHMKAPGWLHPDFDATGTPVPDEETACQFVVATGY